MAGLFITGTDTGVGKTHVGVALARALASQGIDVGVMKPAETGCRLRRGVLFPADARQLMNAADVPDPLDMVCPYRFRLPLAPAVAAEQEGKRIKLSRILSAFRSLATRHDFLIIEGAGGIMVPLGRRTAYIDLAEKMRLPVLIVARSGLGTINHTILTVMAIRQKNIPVAGIILNDAVCRRRERSSLTNPEIIQRMTGVPVLASLRHGAHALPSTAVQQILSSIGRSAHRSSS